VIGDEEEDLADADRNIIVPFEVGQEEVSGRESGDI
jgi:hypothetical protein